MRQISKVNNSKLYSETSNHSLSSIPSGWKISTVGDAFEICNNLRFPISQEERANKKGIYPYYGPTKIQDYINEYRVDGKFALIGEDGDHFLKWKDSPMTLLVEGKFNVNNHAHLVKGTTNLTEWFFYYFNHKELTPYLTRQGAGRYKLTKHSLEKIPIQLPPYIEQVAITKLLSICDLAISKLDQLISQKELQKKWLIDQLLSGKKRLKGFTNEWQFLRFKEIYSPLKQRVTDNNLLILSVTKDGIVSQEEYFNKEIASEDKSKYLTVRKGDMVMSGLNFWMGSIDVLSQYEKGMVSPAYKVFEIQNSRVSDSFMKYYIRSEKMRQCLIGSSVVGASVVRRNLDYETLEEWSFHLPDIQEQIAIAKVLQSCDEEIKLLREKLKKLKKQKMGLMQQLLTGKIRLQTKA